MQVRRPLRILSGAAVAVASLVGVAAPTTAATRTITYAEAPGANPNYIFPYASCPYASANNLNQFQMLMYRPLYWFGLASSTEFVPALSPAKAPAFSNGNRTVTIVMKGWRFADGQAVNARSVMFFLNLYKSDPTAFCGYNAGFGIPDQVRTATARANTVRITFTAPVNPNWILYNYLSEITPLPDAWDRSSPTQSVGCATGAYGAATTVADCKAAETYLDAQALDPTTYTGSLWRSGVDGPWRLTAFDKAGNATFRPNPSYSGPRKAQVGAVREIAYPTAQAEENDLRAGKLTIGYLDPSVLTTPAPANGRPGANWAPLSARYTMTTGSTWSFNYAPFNFSTADPKSAALNQLYVRQALQYAVNQGALIQGAFKGYGTPIYSPLPPHIRRSLANPITNPYPFSLAMSQSLLAAHGWTVVNGVQTCTNPGTDPGQCGPGIDAGYVLSFNVVWASGSPSLDTLMNSEIASWQKVGIQVVASTASFNTVIGDCSGGSGFEICSWGNGWTYSPHYYPSGEALFAPGGGFNVGSYSDPVMTNLIAQTTAGTATLTAYASYAAKQLPVLYQPQPTLISEVAKTLRSSAGLSPNPLGNFMPEYYHF